MGEINNIHDTFFRESMSHKDCRIGIFNAKIGIAVWDGNDVWLLFFEKV